MDIRLWYGFLTIICFLNVVVPDQLYISLTINNQFYFLSTTTTDAYTARRFCSSQLPAELALFNTNDEYHTVSDYLTAYFRNWSLSFTDVWVNLYTTDFNHDNLYEHRWKTQEFDQHIWSNTEPTDNCLRPSIGECCARLTWRGQNFDFLRDKWCTESGCNYLCKSVNECRENKHNCSHICIDKAYGYECLCFPGYTLMNDKANCSNVSKCSSNSCNRTYTNELDRQYSNITEQSHQEMNQCGNNNTVCNGICLYNSGIYICSCSAGYSSTEDNDTCKDIDECSSGMSECQHYCENYEGTYACKCMNGYSLMSNNTSCEDNNECLHLSQPCSGLCVNTEGSYFCVCQNELEEDLSSCLDLNECSLDIHKCVHVCQHTVDGYNCIYLDGDRQFSHNVSINQSNNVTVNQSSNVTVNQSSNETVNQSSNVTVNQLSNLSINQSSNVSTNQSINATNNLLNTTSINQLNNASMSQSHNAHHDIEEGREGEQECSQICNNTEDSYSCACYNGYTLDLRDNSTCLDINECLEHSDNCQHRCRNTHGSFYCTCNNGFTLHQDGISCVEISRPHQCACSCWALAGNGYNNQLIFIQKIEDIQRMIGVKIHQLSTSNRLKTSALDERLSSQLIACSGIVLIVIFVCVILISDAITVIRFVISK